jgi:hypothetical protein
VVGIALLLVACQSAASVGVLCTRGSDCPGGIVCALGRCRTACVQNRDCPIGARCLVGSCSLDVDDACSGGGNACPTPLACVAGRCESTCTTSRDCPSDGECLPLSGVSFCFAPTPGIDAGFVDASRDAGLDANVPDANVSFESTGAEGAYVAPMGVSTLTHGVHHFTTITIPLGATVHTDGTGVLELRATGDVFIGGTLDVSGGHGGAGVGCAQTSGFGGGGGATGTAIPGADGVATGYASGGAGGLGQAGTSGSCGAGGMFGGGAGAGFGSSCTAGGGGGFAGGGGRDGSGASVPGYGTGGGPGQGGEPVLTTPYRGGDGNQCSGNPCAGAGGGSIGLLAEGDLAMSAMTFFPGSGGGGGNNGNGCAGGGGGGGGGALRISSLTSITIDTGASVLANGGDGGAGGATGGGRGGGGSGGAIYLMAPSFSMMGTVSAAGGRGDQGPGCACSFGGAGGIGRVRLSIDPAHCTIIGSVTPPVVSACMLTTPAMYGHTYIAQYPN